MGVPETAQPARWLAHVLIETHTSMTQAHILLVEDDAELARWVRDFLIDENYAVSIAERGDIAVEQVRDKKPDLVLLDIRLPGKDGHQVCRELREFYQRPVIILTANDEEMDEILGLEMGADDFIPKPVRPRVLLARIKAQLRRYQNPVSSPSRLLIFGNLTIDSSAKSVLLNQQPIKFSTAEFELLWVLASHAGEVMSRDQLLHELRGLDYDGVDRTVDMRISRLRKKLGDSSEEPEKIKTVWGKGYLFVAGAW